MSNLTKLYQIQELINKTQLYFTTENRLELNEYIQTLIKIEQEKLIEKEYRHIKEFGSSS